jgi:hypothetical protein
MANCEFQSVKTEQDAENFQIDIVAVTDLDELVIIENQLEQTDHGHLGQLVTYASARDAKYVVRSLEICERSTEEHSSG